MNPRAPNVASMSAAEWLLLVLLSVLWGGSFFFNKVALYDLPPLTIVCARVGLGALVLILAARAMGLSLPRKTSAWAALAGMGFLNNVVPFSLIVWSQQHITSGLASILNATTPLFAVVVAHVATTDDKLTRGRVVGLLAGFAGVVIMIGPDLLRQIGSTDVMAQLAMLVSSLFYALSGVYGRRFAGEPAVTVAAGQMTTAALMLLPLVLLIDRPWMLPPPSPATLGSIVGLAVLSTALGYLIYFRVLARAGATNLLLVTFLIPVSAILLGVGMLGETLAPRQFAGMLVIGLGLAAIDGRPARWIGHILRPRPKGRAGGSA
jgi:drug/metabolite transporter (DMT)-like permease